MAKDGKVLYSKAFGWKDVENRVPANVDDYYVPLSQTKAVVTVAFVMLFGLSFLSSWTARRVEVSALAAVSCSAGGAHITLSAYSAEFSATRIRG